MCELYSLYFESLCKKITGQSVTLTSMEQKMNIMVVKFLHLIGYIMLFIVSGGWLLSQITSISQKRRQKKKKRRV